MLLKVLALINTSFAQSGGEVEPSSGLSPQLVLDSFVQAWRGICDNEDIDDSVRASQHAQHATATVDVICTLGKQVGNFFFNTFTLCVRIKSWHRCIWWYHCVII